VALVLPCALQTAFAQPATEEEQLKTWVQTEIARARNQPGQAVRLRWTDTQVYTPKPAKLAQFEAAVKYHPAHPLKNFVPVWQANARGNFQVFAHQLWWKDHDKLRFNTDYPGQGVYIDQTRAGSAVWDAASGTLRIPEPSTAGAAVDAPRNNFQFPISGFLTSGFFAVTGDHNGEPTFAYDGSTKIWRVNFIEKGSEGKRSVTFTVRWDAASSRFFSISQSFEGLYPTGTPDDRLVIPTRSQFEDYHYFEDVKLWSPRRITNTNNDAEPCNILTLEELTSLDDADFRSVTALPAGDRSDPVRGVLTPEPAPIDLREPRNNTSPAPTSPDHSGRVFAVGAFMLLGGLIFTGVRLTRRQSPSARPAPQRRGFSLIEVVVVIAVVAVLVALLVPSLIGVRRDARAVKSLANCAQHTKAHLLYVGDHADAFYAPPLPAPDDLDGIITVAEGARTNYWSIWKDWDDGMSGSYTNTAEREPFRTPFTETRRYSNSYAYACTFIARPEFWNRESREAGIGQYGAVKVSEVQFPDKKSIIHDFNLFHFAKASAILKKPWLAAFVDGSAAADVGSLPGYPDGEEGWPGSFGLHSSTHPDYNGRIADGLHTLGGVRGRDR
jgi:prepilin-type N-terminal cleavage/methylation domain-containing protein